jgi:hypothetical protein
MTCFLLFSCICRAVILLLVYYWGAHPIFSVLIPLTLSFFAIKEKCIYIYIYNLLLKCKLSRSSPKDALCTTVLFGLFSFLSRLVVALIDFIWNVYIYNGKSSLLFIFIFFIFYFYLNFNYYINSAQNSN